MGLEQPLSSNSSCLEPSHLGFSSSSLGSNSQQLPTAEQLLDQDEAFSQDEALLPSAIGQSISGSGLDGNCLKFYGCYVVILIRCSAIEDAILLHEACRGTLVQPKSVDKWQTISGV